MTPSSLQSLLTAAGSFMFHFTDKDNTFANPSRPVPTGLELTTLALRIGSVDVSLWGTPTSRVSVDSATLVSARGVDLWSDTAAGKWNSKVNVRVPVVKVVALVRDGNNDWIRVAEVKARVGIGLFSGYDVSQKRERQKAWVDELDCDGLLGRVGTRRGEGVGCGVVSSGKGGLIANDIALFDVEGVAPWSYFIRNSDSQNFEKRLNDGDMEFDMDFITTGFESESRIQSPQESTQIFPMPNTPPLSGKSQQQIPYKSQLKRHKILQEQQTLLMGLFPHFTTSSIKFDLEAVVDNGEEWVDGKAVREVEEAGSGDDPQVEYTTWTLDASDSDVFVAPIFLKVFQDWLELDEEKEIDLNSVLDKIQLEVMKELTKSQSTHATSTSLKVSIPKLTIHSIQDILLPNSPTFLNDNLRTRKLPTSSDALCHFDLSINNAAINSTITSDSMACNITVDDVHADMQFISATPLVSGIPQPHTPMNSTTPLMLTIDSQNIDWQFTDHSMKLHCSVLRLGLTNQTAELLFGAASIWTTFYIDLARMVSAHAVRQASERQRVVAGIVVAARRLGVRTDPPFVCAPSSAWLMGLHAYQKKRDWMLLAHVRFCLKALDTEAWKTVRASGCGDEAEASLKAAFDGWRGAWDVGDLADVGWVARLFGNSHNATGSSVVKVLSSGTAVVTVDRLVVEVFEHALKNDGGNRLVARGVDIGVVSNGKRQQGSVPLTFVEWGICEEVIMEVAAHVSVKNILIDMDPHMFGFLRHLVRVYRWFKERAIPDAATREIKDTNVSEIAELLKRKGIPGLLVVTSFAGSLEALEFTASANPLILQARLDTITVSLCHVVDLRNQKQMASGSLGVDLKSDGSAKIASASVALFEKILKRPLMSSSILGTPETILLPSLELGVHEVASDIIHQLGQDVSMGFAVGDLNVRLPRSLLKLKSFADNWSDEQMTTYDYLMTAFMAELGPLKERPSTLQQKVVNFHNGVLNINFHLSRFSIESELLSSLRISYLAQELSTVVNHHSQKTNYTFRLASHEIKFLTRSNTPYEQSKSWTPQSSTFVFPAIVSSGFFLHTSSTRTSPVVEAALDFDTIETVLNANVVDQLFTTRVVLGNEMNEIIDVFLFYNRKAQAPDVDNNNIVVALKPKTRFQYAFKVSVKGLRVEAESPAGTLVFTSGVINSNMRNNNDDIKLLWNVTANDFKLSLLLGKTLAPLAFVVIDMTVQNYKSKQIQEPRHRETKAYITEEDMRNTYVVLVHKAQTVMRPDALNRIADIWIFYRKELGRRKKLKTSDLQKLQENTTKLFKSMNIPLADTIVPKKSFFDDKRFDIILINLSAAIPLVESDELIVDNVSDPKIGVAFVVSAKSIVFDGQTHLNASGQIRDLCIEFNQQFDLTTCQSRDVDPNRNDINRFLLRKVQAKINEIDSQSVKRSLQISASVKGFEVQINADIMNLILNLLNIYDKGKQQVVALIPTSTDSLPTKPKNEDVSLGKTQSWIFEVDGNINFEEGIWIIQHSQLAPSFNSNESKNTSKQRLIFPGISVAFTGDVLFAEWSEKMWEPNVNGLHFEVLVHPSENAVNPGVLEFIENLASSLNQRRKIPTPENTLQKFSQTSENATETTVTPVATTESPTFANLFFFGSSNSITLNLRFSQTKVELNTFPISKVALILNMDEANLFVSWTSPRNRDLGNKKHVLMCTSSVIGTFASLRHMYSPEDCLRAEIPKLIVSTSGIQEIKANRKYSIIVSLPTCLLSVNMRHMQDLFLFLQLWLPTSGNVLQKVPAESRNKRKMLSQISNALSFKDIFALSIQVAKIDLSFDLGQAIGKSLIQFNDIFVNGTVAWNVEFVEMKAFTFGVGALVISCEGRLSGLSSFNGLQVSLEVQNILSLLRKESSEAWGIDVALSIKNIAAQIDYQQERVLILDLDKVTFFLKDSWDFGKNSLFSESKVTISQDVQIGDAKIIISRRTIPSFLDVFNRISGLLEEKRLSVAEISSSKQNSSIFMRTKSVTKTVHDKSDHPGRSLFLENSNHIPFLGLLRLTLGDTFVTLCRYNFRDPEYAQFLTKGCTVQFSHSPFTEKFDETTVIELLGFTVRKATGKPISVSEERDWTTLQWFGYLNSASNKTVFEVPKSNMVLKTVSFPLLRRVEFSLSTDFSDQIDIALNIGLYKYLRELIENYSRFVGWQENENVKDEKKSQTPTVISEKLNELSPKGFAALFNLKPKETSSKTKEETSNVTENEKFEASTNVPVGGHAQKEEEHLLFLRNGEMKFDPLLKVTGDATPWEWIEWISKHKERVPRWIFIFVTRNTALVFDTANRILYSHLVDSSEPKRVKD
ncbi:hypothetical protein HK096_004024 [Nowakowskiella sp. JEL0078]|nr:hypothetical protein HK096_004024 [Nowakowskiella sp. JEL0078]